jgi:predicted DNA-binding protein
MERVNFHLTDGEIRGLKIISELTGVPRAEIIRRAIDDYINRKKFEGFTGLENIREVFA